MIFIFDDGWLAQPSLFWSGVKTFFFAIYQHIKTLMDLARVLSVQVLNHFELSLITHFFSLSDSVN